MGGKMIYLLAILTGYYSLWRYDIMISRHVWKSEVQNSYLS